MSKDTLLTIKSTTRPSSVQEIAITEKFVVSNINFVINKYYSNAVTTVEFKRMDCIIKIALPKGMLKPKDRLVSIYNDFIQLAMANDRDVSIFNITMVYADIGR